MVEVIPAILTTDPRELEEKIRALEGIVKKVQVDIADGVFADNRTVTPDALGRIETSLLLDFHLMAKEPEDWVERCIEGGCERIIGHIEQMSSQESFVGKVVEAGAKVGLALDLETPVSTLDEVLLTSLDVVLVMSVKAGFGGQEFDSRVLSKVKMLDEIRIRDRMPFRICVDGGINGENLKEVVGAGADEVAVGRRLWEGDLLENMDRLRKAAYG